MFNIGDRVRNTYSGEMGTFLAKDRFGLACVRWDEFRGSRHDCCGLCEMGHGWNVFFSEIELCKENDLGELPPSVIDMKFLFGM